MLGAGRAQWSADGRDLFVALAPFYDCARQLGLDPATFFAQVAESGPPELREAVRDFGKLDVTLAAYGYALVATPDGPRYEITAQLS